MKKYIYASAITLLVSVIAVLASVPPIPVAVGAVSRHIAPDYLYPDPKLTPGKIATSDFKELTSTVNGLTYSKNHRVTPQSMKNQVCKEYPVNCKGNPRPEVDHFVPLALGGADDALNLWEEPDTIMWNGQDWGYHTKDKLEAYMIIQMKKGKIAPKDAQNCIMNDWVSCYKQYIK